MKRLLLPAFVLCAAITVQAQNDRVKVTNGNKPVPFTSKERNLAFEIEKKVSALRTNPGSNDQPRTQAGNVTLGETFYDLQSNSAVPRKIVNWGDGTLSVIWTTASDQSYADRGTAYQYFNGTTWRVLQRTRLETLRTGFGSIASNLLNGTQEVIVSHETTNYNLMLGKNDAKGDTTWNFSVSGSEVKLQNCGTGPALQGAIWPRVAVGGATNNSIHVIATYADTCSKKSGIQRPFVYSRSLDGGTTWIDKSILLPGYDSTRTLVGSAEDYAIDASGLNVAVVYAGLGEDVALYKSINDGTTWQKMYVDSFPFAPDYVASMPMDSTHPTNDGSVSVTLDANGNAHVAYANSGVGLSSSAVSASNPEGAIFQPGTISLTYWNEIEKKQVEIPIMLSDVDVDGDGQYMVGDWTTNVDAAQGPAARYGNNSILHKPSVSLDDDGNIFIVFSMPADNDTTPDGQGFRDVWVIASSDSGETWTKAQNLTMDVATGVEESFPSLAKRVDDFLHITYQEDFEPGTALTNDDNPDGNSIVYMKVAKDVVLAGSIGVNETKKPNFSVTEIYPNPFSETATLSVVLSKNSDVEVSIYNTVGQLVVSQKHSNLAPGRQNLIIDGSNLKSGIYFYSVVVNGEKITKKMIIE